MDWIDKKLDELKLERSSHGHLMSDEAHRKSREEENELKALRKQGERWPRI